MLQKGIVMDEKIEPCTIVANDVFIMDVILKLKALENLLISNGIFTEKDYFNEQEKVAKQIANSLLNSANKLTES